jgi:hypothetical protein
VDTLGLILSVEVIPFRWRVERTFAWLGRWRRLSKDYEATTSSSEAMVKLTMIHLMARRLPKVLAKTFPTDCEKQGTSCDVPI